MSLCMSVDTNVQLARLTRAGRWSIPETSFRSFGYTVWEIAPWGRGIDTELWMKPPWFKGIFNVAVWDQIGYPEK